MSWWSNWLMNLTGVSFTVGGAQWRRMKCALDCIMTFSNLFLWFFLSSVLETAEQHIGARRNRTVDVVTELVPGVFTEKAVGVLVGWRFHLNGEWVHRKAVAEDLNNLSPNGLAVTAGCCWERTTGRWALIAHTWVTAPFPPLQVLCLGRDGEGHKQSTQKKPYWLWQSAPFAQTKCWSSSAAKYPSLWELSHSSLWGLAHLAAEHRREDKAWRKVTQTCLFLIHPFPPVPRDLWGCSPCISSTLYYGNI